MKKSRFFGLLLCLAFGFSFSQEEIFDEFYSEDAEEKSVSEEVLSSEESPEDLSSVASSMSDSLAEVTPDESDGEAEVTTDSELIDANLVENSIKEDRRISDTKKLSSKEMNVGIHFNAAYAIMTNNEENSDVDPLDGIDPFEKWAGLNAEGGFAFVYFFNTQIAVVTGLDFKLLSFVRFGNGEKIVYLDKDNFFAEKGTHRAVVNNQSLIYYGVSLPLQVRFYATEVFWLQAGAKFDWFVGGAIRYNLVDYSIVAYSEAYEPFKIESFLDPKLALGLGFTLPISGLNVDVGLTFSYGSSDIEIDYNETMRPFEIGLELNFWFL